MTSLHDQQTHVPSQQYQMHFNVCHPSETEKPAAWNNQIFINQQLQRQLASRRLGLVYADMPRGYRERGCEA